MIIGTEGENGAEAVVAAGSQDIGVPLTGRVHIKQSSTRNTLLPLARQAFFTSAAEKN